MFAEDEFVSHSHALSSSSLVVKLRAMLDRTELQLDPLLGAYIEYAFWSLSSPQLSGLTLHS